MPRSPPGTTSHLLSSIGQNIEGRHLHLKGAFAPKEDLRGYLPGGNPMQLWIATREESMATPTRARGRPLGLGESGWPGRPPTDRANLHSGQLSLVCTDPNAKPLVRFGHETAPFWLYSLENLRVTMPSSLGPGDGRSFARALIGGPSVGGGTSWPLSTASGGAGLHPQPASDGVVFLCLCPPSTPQGSSPFQIDQVSQTTRRFGARA